MIEREKKHEEEEEKKEKTKQRERKSTIKNKDMVRAGSQRGRADERTALLPFVTMHLLYCTTSTS